MNSTPDRRLAQEMDRRARQRDALLSLLTVRGKEGATNVELSKAIGLRFGGRIHELRQAGYQITGANLGGGLWRYWYMGLRDDDAVVVEPHAPPPLAHHKEEQLDLIIIPPPPTSRPEYPR